MSKKKYYAEVPGNPDFPKLEEEVLSGWKKESVFEKSVAARASNIEGQDNEFVFYDGPPFANGLPHYGHLLTGFVKDIFARYQTIKGKKVERRFGWDCHGLPAEMGAEKELGISGRYKIMEYGIDKFNDQCRTSVMKFAGEWEKYVDRQARWVDFKNGYKTMDKNYMESVLWAFKQLYDKGLVYESMRVMPYSWACETPLSNFETRMDNSYRERADKAVTVAFTLDSRPEGAPEADEYKLLAWTTTPWTLPSNLALAVGENIEYACVIVEQDGASGDSLPLVRGRVREGADADSDSEEYAVWKNPKELIKNAQELRKNQTDIEKLLWSCLRRKQIKGYKFRQQHPIEKYVLDFVCLEEKLVIELDGSQHAEQKEYDDKRTAFLESKGYKVLRFWNSEVIENLEGVLQTVWDALPEMKEASPHPNPPPHAEGGNSSGHRVCYILAASSLKYVVDITTKEKCRYWVLHNDHVEAGFADDSLESKPIENIQKIDGFKGQYGPLGNFTGKNLLGLTYKPLFPYFADRKAKGAFKILAGDFVTEGDGTGVVHLAPGFGEDDFALCEKEKIFDSKDREKPLVCPVDNAGKFTAEIYDIVSNLPSDAIEVGTGVLLYNLDFAPEGAPRADEYKIFGEKVSDSQIKGGAEYLCVVGNDESNKENKVCYLIASDSMWKLEHFIKKYYLKDLEFRHRQEVLVKKPRRVEVASYPWEYRSAADDFIEIPLISRDFLVKSGALFSTFQTINVLETNDDIIKYLKAQGSWIKTEQYLHNYPHCWRTDTPLIYKAVPSWYVEVTKFKDRMVELNQQINWIPNHIKDGQFGKWLENARDWSISRNRFWGSPIPIWKSDNPKNKELYVFGSIAELEAFFETKVPDLHRPFIDELTKPDPYDSQYTLRRVEDVFDCWFESGSMPYAQAHYPFENKDWFECHFPADFIVEYVAQTRGWFYTLMVLSTALFDRPPFLNVICHGVVLDEKGQKLSKRLNNYADPMDIFSKFGADAMRWVMISGPIMNGGDLLIDKEGNMVRDAVRLILKPIWNSYSFFVLYANADGVQAKFQPSSDNLMDRYILAKCKDAVQKVEAAMDAYDTPLACKAAQDFFEVLNNWHIRRNKERFWKSEHDTDKFSAYNTLYTVLHIMCRAMSPLLPLLTEKIWQGLGEEASVHLADFPDVSNIADEAHLVHDMDRVRDACNAALSIRGAENIRVRQPLASLTIVDKEPERLKDYADLIKDEVNVKEVKFSSDVAAKADLKLKVNFPALGKRLPEKMKEVIAATKQGNWKQTADGRVEVVGEVLSLEECSLQLEPKDKKGAQSLSTNDALVILDLDVTGELKIEGVARDLVRLVQQSRKDAGLEITDRIALNVAANNEDIMAALDSFGSYIAEQTLSVSVSSGDTKSCKHHFQQKIDGDDVTIGFNLAA